MNRWLKRLADGGTSKIYGSAVSASRFRAGALDGSGFGFGFLGEIDLRLYPLISKTKAQSQQKGKKRIVTGSDAGKPESRIQREGRASSRGHPHFAAGCWMPRTSDQFSGFNHTAGGFLAWRGGGGGAPRKAKRIAEQSQ